MKISIITPAYNAGKTINKTIESIIAQNYQDLEYIIIDNLSSDNTKDIISKHQDRLKINFVSEKDNGIYDAMNKGLRIATGEVVGILNADDFYDSKRVLEIVAKSFEDPSVDIVYGDVKYFSKDENKIKRYWKGGGFNDEKINNGWTIPHPTLFVRRKIYEEYGFFNTTLKIAADYEFILRILKKHKVKAKYSSEIIVKMYNSGNSAKNIIQRIKGWKELKKSWEINGFDIPPFFILRRLLYKISQFFIKQNNN